IFIRFFRFLDLWYLCYEQSLSDKTLVMWFEFVESICEDFLYSDFDEELKLKIIKIARTCFCEQTQNCEFELPLSVIKAVLEKALADNDIRYEGKIGIRFQSWKNTFIEDAKVLIIMGLSEGEFPGNDTKNDLDIFKNKLPQLNQSKRASDKNLMLTALTSNLDKLVLTYIGYEQSTNEIIPASTVVEDLVTYLKQKTNDVFAIQHHFMHGFNQHYFSKEQQSYILNNFKLAKKYYQKSPIDKNTDIRIDKTLETVISIHQLSEFFSNPLDFFIENVAELQLKIYSNELKSTETYQPDKLEEWKLKSHIFQHDIEIAKKTGLLADSPLSHNYYNKFSKELYSLSEKYQQTEIHSQDIELNFEEFKLYGVVHLNDKNQLVDFKTGKAKGKYIIKHWISYLCYQPESESYLYFEDKIVKFNPIQNAPELLSIILEKWRLIHQQPWLFHPAAMVNVRTNDIALATEIAYYNSLKGNERFPATEGQRYFLQQLLDYDYQSDVEEYIKPLLESIELVDYSEVIDATV
ncbi:MAG: exodeoxyribonuclease V subunit gamma, partial [Xanthomonadales bacterium]|nr:exodeoxyribonuclease V subunit gamma [Xanthomonadales bacterium]